MSVQTTRDFLFRQIALACPTDPKGVNQGEQIVEGRVASGGAGHTAIEGLHGSTLHRSLRVWPNRRDLIRRADFARQDGSSPSGRHSTGDFFGAGRKSVRHAVYEEIAEGYMADFLGFGIDQTGFAQPADGGMHFRGAHSQFLAQLRITSSGSTKAELERYDDIL